MSLGLRRYWEKTGIVAQLTKIWFSLYKKRDKPTIPIDFMQRNMKYEVPEVIDKDNLKNEYL